MASFEIIRKPVITEKTTLLQERDKYVFEVDPRASKAEVKQAVEDAFDVQVIGVNVMNVKPKTKRFGPRLVPGKKRKKAIVTLQHGEKIEIFSGA